MKWQNYIEALNSCMAHMETTGKDAQPLQHDAAFALWHDMAVHLRQEGGVIYLIGNGASASMASHFAADLFKNGGIHTHLFTDAAGLTAIGNDISYEQIYAYPLERYATPKDMLVAISSSGQSPNILRAAEAARTAQTKIATLSGFSADNALRRLGDINFYVPAQTYGLVESSHAAILHHWMDSLLL